MYVYKNFSARGILSFAGGHLVWISAWTLFVTAVYELAEWRWFSIPWLPVSLIGTAVAFYIGFKNNSAYDRLWEARKIWGAIVNDSRSWAASTRAFVSNQFINGDADEALIRSWHQQLIYRHIAWLYTLRNQLLVPTSWEHIAQNRLVKRTTENRRRSFGIELFSDALTYDRLEALLPPNEISRLEKYKNVATQLIDHQAQELKQLRKLGAIDDFRHMDLQKLLNNFYTHQGKCERIKKFPLPRQYGSMSFVFVGIFIGLLPLGMLSVFSEADHLSVWLSVPFSILVAWVYLIMELVGDYSENPFEGLGNDIPMLSLCRTIEIDLRQMLGETDLPPAIEAKNGVLM